MRLCCRTVNCNLLMPLCTFVSSRWVIIPYLSPSSSLDTLPGKQQFSVHCNCVGVFGQSTGRFLLHNMNRSCTAVKDTPKSKPELAQCRIDRRTCNFNLCKPCP